MKKIYIAGAHSRARTLRIYLEYLYPDMRVEAFVVDDMADNKEVVDGVPVKLIDSRLNPEYTVYLGVRGVNHARLTDELQSVGMREIIPVTADLDSQLRNRYIASCFSKEGRSFRLVDNLPFDGQTENEVSAKIYVAHSVYDKPLQDKYIPLKDETNLQVGAALTKSRISEEALTDDQGENISARNRQYCELTGLYWIWKNADEDYKGLVQYRRHFLLPDDWRGRMAQNHVDIILPVPLYVAPSIADNYRERHIASDWEYLMQYFQEMFPEEYASAQRIFQGNLYCPCNMLIAKREVLDKLCEWLFPIVDAVVGHGGEKADPYQNRYPGFISERLITYFFESHRYAFNVVYANKNFLS